MTNKRERRFLESDVKLETREANQPRISGYAAKFNVRSVPLGNFVEEIDPQAFDAFLANPSIDTVALFNHDQNLPLARRSAGNLKIGVDDIGLWYVVDPVPDTSYAQDLIENLRMGIVKHSSFGFYVNERGDEWTKDADGTNVRKITSARVADVSPVLSPAYPDATSQLRALFPDGTDHLRKATEDEARYRVYQHLMLDSLRITARRTR